MISRNDEDVLLLPQPLDEIDRSDVQMISQVGNSSRLRRYKSEVVGVCPVIQDRIVRIQDVPRARKQASPVLGSQRYSREQIARGSRTDCGVVVIRPGLRHKLGSRRDPSDSQARQAVSFRQPAGDDQLFVSTPEARRLVALTLG